MEDNKLIAPTEDMRDGNSADDYIKAIKDLKENTVSKKDYETLENEKKSLLNALVNGQSVEVDEKKTPSIEELRNKVFGPKTTDLDYAENVIALRNACLAANQADPFLPSDNVTYDDKLSAENFAACLSHCIEVAAGDPVIFDNEFHRIIK